MFSANSGRPWAKYASAPAHAEYVTFMKSGERPIMPHVVRAQCIIMTRRRSSSSRVRGMMNESPTRSPVVREPFDVIGLGAIRKIAAEDDLRGGDELQ